jgi:hypothetical protein
MSPARPGHCFGLASKPPARRAETSTLVPRAFEYKGTLLEFSSGPVRSVETLPEGFAEVVGESDEPLDGCSEAVGDLGKALDRCSEAVGGSDRFLEEPPEVMRAIG